MPSFAVICTNFETGEDYRIAIDAATPQDAVKQAIALGHLTDGRVATGGDENAIPTTHYATQTAPAQPATDCAGHAQPTLEQTVMRLEEELVRLSTKVDDLVDKKWLEWRIAWGVMKGLLLFSFVGFVMSIVAAVVIFFVIGSLAASRLQNATGPLQDGGIQQQLDTIMKQLNPQNLQDLRDLSGGHE